MPMSSICLSEAIVWHGVFTSQPVKSGHLCRLAKVVAGMSSKRKQKLLEMGCGFELVLRMFITVDSMCQRCLSHYHADKLSMIKFIPFWSYGCKILLAG